MRTGKLIGLVLLLVSVSCNNADKLEKEENDGDPVYSIESDDEQMILAIEMAVTSYEEFARKLDHPDSSDTDFAIKLRFPTEEGTEHMWLNNLFRWEGKIYGILDSDPLYETSVKSGDTIGIDKEKLSDWMYLRNDTLVGGFTIRVLYKKMSRDEKREFRETTSFIIDLDR